MADVTIGAGTLAGRGVYAARDFAADNPRVGTTVNYWIPLGMRDNVSLEIVDASGQEVRKRGSRAFLAEREPARA